MYLPAAADAPVAVGPPAPGGAAAPAPAPARPRFADCRAPRAQSGAQSCADYRRASAILAVGVSSQATAHTRDASMYEQYYGFVQPPFTLTPDPRFLYRSESHEEAITLLQQAIRRKEGFIVLTGDIGTGKTTSCRALLEQLDASVFTSLILNPFLSVEELLRGPHHRRGAAPYASGARADPHHLEPRDQRAEAAADRARGTVEPARRARRGGDAAAGSAHLDPRDAEAAQPRRGRGLHRAPALGGARFDGGDVRTHGARSHARLHRRRAAHHQPALRPLADAVRADAREPPDAGHHRGSRGQPRPPVAGKGTSEEEEKGGRRTRHGADSCPRRRHGRARAGASCRGGPVVHPGRSTD